MTAGPTCPVERVGSPCPPNPVGAEVDAHDPTGRLVATTRSGGDGGYRLRLAAGTYTLTVVVAGTFPRCPAVTVTVSPGTVSTAAISCDTGIR